MTWEVPQYVRNGEFACPLLLGVSRVGQISLVDLSPRHPLIESTELWEFAQRNATTANHGGGASSVIGAEVMRWVHNDPPITPSGGHTAPATVTVMDL
jgi:hypothetical protein